MPRFPELRPIRRADAAPKLLSADVCVLGAGAAGLSAALEARALGESVVIADAAPQIGGQAVGSAIGTICGLYGNGATPLRLTHGVMDDMLRALIAGGAAAPRRARGTVILEYRINDWLRWGERKLVEAGVAPLTGAVLRRVSRDGGRVEALDFATRYGDLRVQARAFIDASGDAAIPWLADLQLNEADAPILGTVIAVFEDVRTEICGDWPRDRYHQAMRRRGAEFGLVRHDGFVFPVSPGRVLANLTHVETPLDAVGMALAGIEGRAQVDGLLALFADEFPEAWGDAKVAIYGQTGIRQTRTIQGASRLSADEVRAGRPPADRIARCTWPIELHIEAETAHWEVFGPDHMHFVPFGAMAPEGLDNVVVAGRCIDADPGALASVRVMGPCFAMGRAAAMAVALAGSGSLRQIDMGALQAGLAENLEGGTLDPWVASMAE